MANHLDRKPWLWLALGTLLLVGAHVRFGLGALAWLAPVPFLHYLRCTRGLKSRALFAVAMVIAWNLAVAKIVTPPVPFAFVPLFALPLAVLLGAPYLLWSWVRSAGETAASLVFAASAVVAEWLLHAALPFGTWGAAANTQLEALPLLQLASVAGLHGVSFLVYAVAASREPLLEDRTAPRLRHAGLMLGAVGVAWGAGEARLGGASGAATETRRVAAVGTDATFGGRPIPSPEELRTIEEGLFRRTRAAARAGAQLVVWTEAATLVHPPEEPAWRERLSGLAGEAHLHLVAAYIVPVSLEPLLLENKYAFLSPAGRVEHLYLKHHPVPGEPAIRGEAPMPLVVTEELGRLSGAICYDYDFPRLSLEQAARDVDLVALPSSDWRGIDPIHTQMAALRAIEGGHSVVRSARFGLSAGIDPYGRLRGWLSHWDDEDRVLLVNLPRHGTRTVYAVLGDWFPLVCLVLSAGVGARAWRQVRLREVLAC